MLIIISKVANGRGQLPVALDVENLEGAVERGGEGGRDRDEALTTCSQPVLENWVFPLPMEQ